MVDTKNETTKSVSMLQESEEWKKLPPEVKSKINAVINKKDVLKLTYDRVFRAIFDPDIHRPRLERFLSQLMGRSVKIIESVPVEGNNRTVDAKRIYLDILVKFEDESYANIEMQKIGRLFPNARAAVYSSDLIIRQYTKAKSEIRERQLLEKDDEEDQKEIDYRVIKKVYTIVIIEDSPSVFDDYRKNYIHHGKTIFDTGLDMDMMQEYIFVNLDYFGELISDPETELEAWLAFLNAETVGQINQIIKKFPYFQNILDDVILYVETKPEEVQRAMVEYSVEMDMNGFKNQYREEKNKVKQLQEEKIELQKCTEKLQNDKNKLLNDKNKLLNDKNELQEDNKELQEDNKELQEDNKELQEKNKLLMFLVKAGRTDDILRMETDENYANQLLEEMLSMKDK